MSPRAICAAVGAVVSMLAWIVTGWTESFGIAVLVTVLVAAVCYLIGPPVVKVLTGIEFDGDDW
jgi:hypothetical protein